MSTGNKLADLKALASSAVAEESMKATSLLRQPASTPRQEGRGGERSQTRGVDGMPSRREHPEHGTVTRVPSVLRPRDMKAINAAKIYLMQDGGKGVSTNNIIQMALRSLKISPDLLKLAEEILAEDGRRKH